MARILADLAHSPASEPSVNTTNSLWDFSLKIYALPGVAEQCLVLQDEFGVDVNLLLWSLWLGVRGQLLSPELLSAAEAAVLDWSQLAVQPLRRLRRQLKAHFGVEDSAREAVRQAIKAAELAAENYQQQLLQGLAAATLRPPLAVDGNCRTYLRSRQVPLARIDVFVLLVESALAA